MPEKISPEVFPPLFSAIGETVFNWSLIEFALGSWIAIIYQVGGGRHHAKTIPFSLSPKLKFLRRCFNQIEALKPFAAEGKDILRRIKAIKDNREMMVHGRVTGYSPDDDSYLFVRLDLDKEQTMHVAKESRLGVVEILKDAREAHAIGIAGHNFTVRLLQALVPEDKGKELIRAVRS